MKVSTNSYLRHIAIVLKIVFLICSHFHSLTTAMVEVMTTAAMEGVMRAMEEEAATVVVAMGVVMEIAVMVQVRYRCIFTCRRSNFIPRKKKENLKDSLKLILACI